MDKLKFNHNYILLLVFCLLVGFIAGYTAKKQYNVTQTKIETSQAIIDTNTITNNKATSTDNLNINQEKITIKYHPNGRVASKSIIRTHAVAVNQTKSDTSMVQNQTKIVKTETQVRTEKILPNDRYLLGIRTDITDYKEGVNVTLGIQLINHVYLTTSSDIRKFTPQIGLTVTF